MRPLTFEALTGRPVLGSLWEPGGALSHVRLGQQADLVLVAPATAHLVARMAQGLADDLLTTLLLASTAPVLLAPAMNDEMYAHPQTRANLERVRARGVGLVGPEIGRARRGPVGAARPDERAGDDPGARRALSSGAPRAGSRPPRGGDRRPDAESRSIRCGW